MNSPSNSLRNAAIVLNSLKPEQAEQVLSRLEAGDVRNVFQEIDKLDQVTSRQIFAALDQLARDAQHRLPVSPPALSTASPPQLPLDDPLLTAEQKQSPFFFLARTDPALTTELIIDEHPADIALILAQMPANVAAVQLKSLDPVLRVSVLKRICQLESADPARSHELAYALRIRLNRLLARGGPKSTGLVAASNMLNHIDSCARQELLTHLKDTDPDAAREVESRLFQFANLSNESDESIQMLLRHVDTACWAPALKRAPLDVCKKILGNMGSKPAQLLTREMQALGRVDKHIAAHAQQQILAVFLRLQAQGQLSGRSATSTATRSMSKLKNSESQES